MSDDHFGEKDIRIRQLEEELRARERMTLAAEREISRVWGVTKVILTIGSGALAIVAFLGIRSWSDVTSQLQKSEGEVLTNEVKKIQVQVSDELQRQFAATNIHNLIYDKTKEQINIVAVPMVSALIQSNVYPAIFASSNQIESLRSNIVSAETILRGVFASDRAAAFDFSKPNSCVIQSNLPGYPSNIKYVVTWLLPECPLQGSLRVQYHVFAQPPNSYQSILNEVTFYWGETLENLRAHPVYVWYVPDKSNTNLIRSLTYINDMSVPSLYPNTNVPGAVSLP